MTIQRINEDGRRFDIPPGLRVTVPAGNSIHNTGTRVAEFRVMRQGLDADRIMLAPDDMHTFDSPATVVVPA